MLMRLLAVLAVAAAVMESKPKPGRVQPGVRRNRKVVLLVDEEREQGLDALAIEGFRGNRSAAFSALVDLHAGKALELVREGRTAPPIAVEAWSPSRLSKALVEQVAGMVREGGDEQGAFKALGVPVKQRRAWMKQGRQDMDAGRPSLHATLVYAIGKAEAERDLELVQQVDSAKWLLERLSPETYGPPVRKSESTVQHALNAVIDWDRLDVRETQTLVALLRKASPQADEPAISGKARPVLELLPADVVDADVIAEEDESAPAVSGDVQLDDTEAPPPEKPED